MTQTDWPDYQPSAPPRGRPAIMTIGVALLLALATLAIYLLTLAPTVGWGNDAGMQTDAALLRLGGGADDHPLHVGIAHLMTWLPVGADSAYRVNLASALSGALTVLVLFLTSLALLDRARLGSAPRLRLLYAAMGALSLGVAHGFWLRAVSPSPAALAGLLFALILWLLVRRLLGGHGANIILAVLLLGLLLGVDIGMVVFVPFLLVGGIWLVWHPPPLPAEGRGRFRRGRTVLTVDSDAARAMAHDPAGAPPDGEAADATGGTPPLQPGEMGQVGASFTVPAGDRAPRRRRRPSLLAASVSILLAFSIGLLPLVALEVVDLVRAPLNPDFASEILPGHAGPVCASLAHVATQAVAGRLLPLVPLAAYSGRFVQLGGLLLYSFLVVSALFGIVGALTLLVRRGTIGTGIWLLLLFAVAVAAAVALPSTDLVAAAFPAWIIFALWVGIGAATLVRGRSPWIGAALALVVIGSPIATYLVAPPLADSRPELARLADWAAPPSPGAGAGAQLVPWRHWLRAPDQIGRATLDAVAPDARLLIHEDGSRPLSRVLGYLQRVEGLAPEVEVVSLADAGATLIRRDPVAETATGRPLYLAAADSLDADTATALCAADSLQPVRRGPVFALLPSGVIVSEPDVAPTETSETTLPAFLSPDSTGYDAPGLTIETTPAETPVPTTEATPAPTPAATPPETAPETPAATPPETAPETPAETPDEAAPERSSRDASTGTRARRETSAMANAAVRAALHEADSLFAAGTYWQAAATYGSALLAEGEVVNPASPTSRWRAVGEADVYARYAVALTQSHMPTLSAQARLRYFESMADSVSAHERLGHLFLQAGNPQRAMLELSQVARARPDDASLQVVLAEACTASGEGDRARSHLHHALAIDPGNPEALYRLGRLLEDSADVTGAANVYRQYLELGSQPRTTEVRSRLQALGRE